QLATVRLCLSALQKLPGKKDGSNLLVLVQALRRLPDGKEEQRLREEIAGYLTKLTGKTLPGTDRAGWVGWFRKTFPDLAEKLGYADGVNVAAWNRRLAGIDWTQGDVERGQVVFTKTSCASCHSGAQALGPDLRGATGRFSRADLFTAIVQPSKDVSPRYRTTPLTTAGGQA